GESPPSTTLPDDTGDGSQQNSGETSGPFIPADKAGLRSPQLRELLPTPASPLTDADDEFIELYNPNDRAFDLSGYILESGLTTKHRYTSAAGSSLAPQSFGAFFSADTGLSLSNASGQVRLLDPLGNLLGQSDPY